MGLFYFYTENTERNEEASSDGHNPKRSSDVWVRVLFSRRELWVSTR